MTVPVPDAAGPPAPDGADPAPDPSPFAVLGLDEEATGLYRVLLRHSGQSLSSLAELVGVPEPTFVDHVRRIADAGLVEVSAAAPGASGPSAADVVVARPPQEALARLIVEEARRLEARTRQLDEVRGLLPALTADHLTSAAPSGTQMAIEVLRGGDILQLVRSLSVSSTGDLLWLRPDPWNVEPGLEVDAWVVELLRSGRRSRALYSVAALERCADVVRARAEAGEEVRVVAEVPFRLAVLGRSAALISERVGVFNDVRLVLRNESLVTALSLMFAGLWERASVVPGLGGPPHDERAQDRLLLAHLAAGAKDEQIARLLGTSVRTVRRRVAELLTALGAHSRFQAGAEAARRGWL